MPRNLTPSHAIPGFSIGNIGVLRDDEGVESGSGASWPVGIGPGFHITAAPLHRTSRNVFSEDAALSRALYRSVATLEQHTGLGLGDAARPLFLAVWLLPDAQREQPLHLQPVGLGDATLPGLIRRSGDPLAAYRAFRLLIRDYADIVMEKTWRLNRNSQPDIRRMMNRRCDRVMEKRGYTCESALSAEEHARLAGTYKAMYQVAFGEAFPEEARLQLEAIISAFLAAPGSDPSRPRHLFVEALAGYSA